MRICKQCNENYTNLYTTPDGKYSYTLETKFCSKSCKTKFQRGSLTKESVEEEITKFVLSQNRYCSLKEITIGIKRSSKTINKFKISITDLQYSLGFEKPNSNFENRVYEEIELLFNSVEREKTFEDLVSPKGYKLRYDFYIKEKNLLIEADGVHHSDINSPWYNAYNQLCDRLKNEFAAKEGFLLIRIPYSRVVDKTYVESFLKNIS